MLLTNGNSGASVSSTQECPRAAETAGGVAPKAVTFGATTRYPPPRSHARLANGCNLGVTRPEGSSAMSTTAPAVRTIELTEAEADVIVEHVGVSKYNVAEAMEDYEQTLDEYQALALHAQLIATLWRDALARRLTVTPDARDWLEGARSELQAAVRSDRARFERSEPGKFRDEEERGLLRDSRLLAACDGLLDRIAEPQTDVPAPTQEA